MPLSTEFVVGHTPDVPKGKVRLSFRSGANYLVHGEPEKLPQVLEELPQKSREQLTGIWVHPSEATRLGALLKRMGICFDHAH